MIPDVGPNELADIAGRHVYVFQAGYGSPGPSDRGWDVNEYRVSVIVVEHYDDAAGLPTNAWINDLIEWCETNIWGKLTDTRTVTLSSTAIPFAAEVLTLYDPELLREENLFFSEFLITFREHTAP